MAYKVGTEKVQVKKALDMIASTTKSKSKDDVEKQGTEKRKS